MATLTPIQRLVPLMNDLSQTISQITAILREDAQDAPLAGETEAKTPKLEKAQNSPKAKSSTPKKEAAASDSSTGSSEESKTVYTIEQVRAVLAEKSQSGLTAQVKDLLQSFGSVKLSGIDPARYGELIEAAKALQ